MASFSARRAALGLAPVLVAFASLPVAAGERALVGRSFYQPVRFVVCPGLEETRLWVVGEEETVFGPGERIFQFAYFPDRKRVLPEHIEVRIHAEKACDGADLDANVVVTLGGIFSSVDKAELDVASFRKRLRLTRGDVRLPPRIVRIQCRTGLCPEHGSSRTETAALAPEAHGGREASRREK